MSNEHDDGAFIRMVPDSEADGELKTLISENADPATGKLDYILRVHSLSPRGLKAHLVVYESAMAGTKTLRKVEREMVALVVSDINSCHY